MAEGSSDPQGGSGTVLPPVQAARGGRRAAAMPFIMLTVLIDMVSLGLIIPVLPALVGSFCSSPAEQTFWYTVLTFVYGTANFIGNPVLGALSDAHGRRPVLLIGFAGLCLNFFATAMASALWMLIAVRMVGGAMQSNAAVANAYVADISGPEDRAKRFGMLGAMFGLGFIIGPALGGVLGAINLQLPFYVAGGLATLNLLYGWLVLPESLPPEKRKPFEWRRINPLQSIRDLFALEGVGKLVAVIAFAGLAQFVMYTVWVLYGSFKFGWGPSENGWSLTVVGVMAVIVQGGLLRQFLKIWPAERLAVMGLLSATLSFLGWGLVSEGWMMYVIICANVLGYTVSSALQSIVSRAADERSQGQTLGSVSGLNSLMAVIAPLLGGPLLQAVSHYPQGDWRIGAPYYLCAALQTVALVLAWSHFRGHARSVPQPAPAAGPTA